jgi:DNA-directed RNA polymerase subunit beta
VYEAIVKGENIPEPSIPESFKVLLKEMQSLALDIKVVAEDGGDVVVREEDDELLRAAEELGIDLRPVAGRVAARDPEAQEMEEGSDRIDGDGELTVPNDEQLPGEFGESDLAGDDLDDDDSDDEGDDELEDEVGIEPDLESVEAEE